VHKHIGESERLAGCLDGWKRTYFQTCSHFARISHFQTCSQSARESELLGLLQKTPTSELLPANTSEWVPRQRRHQNTVQAKGKPESEVRPAKIPLSECRNAMFGVPAMLCSGGQTFLFVERAFDRTRVPQSNVHSSAAIERAFDAIGHKLISRIYQDSHDIA
jgi:hypothetical protein